MPNVDCAGSRNDLSLVVVTLVGVGKQGDDKRGFMTKQFPTFQAIMIMGKRAKP